MKIFSFILIMLAYLIMGAAHSYAQGNNRDTTSERKRTADSLSKRDTTSSFQKANQLFASQNNPKTEYKMTKSPWGAIWRSLVLPGWGQLYNESYWKAPLFFAGAATCVYFIIHYNNLYNEYARLYDNLNKGNAFDPNVLEARQQREFNRDYRDITIFYLAGVYIIAAVDAYVGAHLFDFNVNDVVSMSLTTSPQRFLSVKLNFGK